jgi:glutamate-ammonia-ligase adenylyltransferase
LSTRPYYARLTQALITALTAPMAEGKLFDVDMRLRPSGNQGPVATSWHAFRNYQREEAWVWEHLALTRARVVAGPEDLAREVTAFQRDLLAQPSDCGKIAREVAQMRRRIQEAKPAGGVWEVKIGPGRLQEIELMAQAGALLAGQAGISTAEGLQSAADAGLLRHEDAADLIRAADLMSTVHTSVRLLTEGSLTDAALGLAGETFLLRATGQASRDALETALRESYSSACAILDAALTPYETENDTG